VAGGCLFEKDETYIGARDLLDSAHDDSEGLIEARRLIDLLDDVL